MAETTLLKTFFSPDLVRRIGADLSRAHPRFRERAFVKDAASGIEKFELLDRVRHIAAALAKHLPPAYPDALDVILRALGPEFDGDELIGVGMAPFIYAPHNWSPDPDLQGFFKGTTNCLSALVAAGRYDDVLALLELAPYPMWHYRRYGVKALAAQGKKAEAIRYAEQRRGLNDSPVAIAHPRGRAEPRSRVDVEHRLAHVTRRQGRRARYIGTRKNTFDLRRAASIQNLEVLHRQTRGLELAKAS